MNSRIHEVAFFFKQLVSSLLCVIMLLNLAAPAAAQAVSDRNRAFLTRRNMDDIHKRLEKSYEENIRKAFVSESTDTTTPAARQYRQLQDEYFADPIVQRLMKLRDAFMPLGDDLNLESPAEDKFRQHFLDQYNAEVERQAQAAFKRLRVEEEQQRLYIAEQVEQARQANVSDNVIETWTDAENAKIDQAVNVAVAKIRSWQTQSRREADKYYQKVLQEVQAESHGIIASKIVELMDLYKQYPKKTRSYLLEIALSVLMTEGRNTTLFSEADKELLHTLYLQEVENGLDCASKSAGRKCSVVLSAVSALGVLGEGSKDSAVIGEFISKNLETPIAAPALLTGVSSLLAMEQYGAIRGILDEATRRENNLKFILSFSELTEAFININGQYLGDVSKWAQYPVPEDGKVSALGEAPSGNAWEEVAHMLAAEGSPQAQQLLSDYGINMCTAQLKMNLKDEWDIGCDGIKPFLVGAVTSGKAGAYTGRVQLDLQEGYIQDNNGTRYVSAEQAAINARLHNEMVQRVQNFIKSQGLSLPASIARGLYLCSMGDLDADSQLLLDTKLFAYFDKETNGQKNISPALRLLPYAKDSAEYKAKQSRQHRAQAWRNIATLADIAFIVWCAYDLVRLGTKLVNLGRTIYMTTRMARAGLPVEARVAVMRRLKTARLLVGFERAKRSAAFVVSNQARQYMRMEPLLKMPSGSRVAPVLEAVLPLAKRMPKDGSFALDAAQVVKNLKNQPNALPAAKDLQYALNQAVERANSGFASRNGWWSKLVGDRNFIYRRYLSKEIAGQTLSLYRQGDRGRLIDFARAVRSDRSIAVPQKVKELKMIPMVDKKGVPNPRVIRSVLDVLPEGTTSPGRAEIRQAVNLALDRTNVAYANRGWFSRLRSSLFRKNKALYNDWLSDNIIRLADEEGVLSSVTPALKEKMLKLLASSVRTNHNISVPSDIGKYIGRQKPGPKPLYKEMQAAVTGADGVTQPVPLTVRVERKVKGVELDRYQRFVFNSKGKNYFMSISDGVSKPTDLNRFKVKIPANDMPAVIRGVTNAGLETPLELKLTPFRGSRDFRRAVAISGRTVEGTPKVKGNFLTNLWAARRGKENIWIHELPVYLRAADGMEMTAPIKIMADKRLGLEGARFILSGDNKLRLMQGKNIIDNHLFYFGLPKGQTAPFVNLLLKNTFESPLTLVVSPGSNKLLPLFFATGLSLSSASVGLIAPLETTYRDRITDTHKTWISLAFPYLPSLFAPALAPLVMRWGALRVVQAALGTVAVGLTVPWMAGFNGKLNENKLPPLWPLFVSGAGIGISSALSRSGLNILIDTMGGGGKLLRSMMFKNAGSLVLLVPSWLYTWSKLRVLPGITGQTLPESVLAKPAGDFSLAFPVLTVATTGVLGFLSLARISPVIGRSSAVQAGQKMKFWSEMGRSWKTMFAPEVLPLATSAFFFTGFEAAAFSKASSQAFRPFFENRKFIKNTIPGNRKNAISMFTGISVAALPFTARYLAPKLLNAFAKPLQPAYEYKKMLWLSYGMNAAGGLMLMKYGLDQDPQMWQMLAGIGLMGLGTANVTQSLQKLANIKVGSGVTIARTVKGMSAVQAAQRATELKNITMTGFSWSQIGLAAIPLIQSSYVDREVSRGVVSSSKGPLSSIWIPLGSLGLSFGFAARSIGLKGHIPAGLLGASKLAVDGPASFNPLPHAASLYDSYRAGRYDALEDGIRRYLKHEREKADVSAEREKARQERERLLEQMQRQDVSNSMPGAPQLQFPHLYMPQSIMTGNK